MNNAQGIYHHFSNKVGWLKFHTSGCGVQSVSYIDNPRPYGQTRSYKEVAKAAGNSKGARAVGAANKKNPLPILAPCHRVIKSDGSLWGYNSGLNKKIALLKLEGIQSFL